MINNENIEPLKASPEMSVGFTLVELMVVVAIIGVLSAVAIPNYQKFQHRAWQTEAKSGLAHLQTAELTYVVDTNTFTTCLPAIGFVNSAPLRHYSIGFFNGVAAQVNCGPGGNANCLMNFPSASSIAAPAACVPATIASPGSGTNTNYYQANAGAPTPGEVMGGTVTSVSNTDFMANALGNLTNSGSVVPGWDSWTIGNSRALLNDQPAI